MPTNLNPPRRGGGIVDGIRPFTGSMARVSYLVNPIPAFSAGAGPQRDGFLIYDAAAESPLRTVGLLQKFGPVIPRRPGWGGAESEGEQAVDG